MRRPDAVPDANAQAGELASIAKATPCPILFDRLGGRAGQVDRRSDLPGDYLRRINIPTIDVGVVGHATSWHGHL
jgi:hypothetical protein